MKTSFKIVLGILISTCFLASCSRKKNSFLSRNSHALSSKYNILYNGYLALEKGQLAVNEAYNDNYWEILPIERMQISEDVMLPGQSKNQDFERAEEKAVKAIQKHSMNIQGKEKNPQMDEAYLLLGQARYFDQRFVPALDAFNNILNKYPTSDKINQVKIWRAKTNIRLENEELAIDILKRLLRDEKLEGQDLADANAMLAQAYINLKSLDSAVTKINIAAENTKSNDEKGRFRFIQAQLYNRLNYKDSANIAFDKVIELNRKTPRPYLIAAYIGKARNFDLTSDDKQALLELFHELENDRENRPFLSKIYHLIAEHHLKNKSDSLAVEYYNKSLRTNPADKILVADSYENLGNIFFDYSEYKIAGAYYDSTMSSMKENSKPFRIIKRKRENLDDVIYYEDVAEINDSILALVAMSEDEKFAYFQDYTEKLKLQYAAEKEKAEAAERNAGLVTVNNNFGNSNQSSLKGAGGPQPGSAPSFYFYNPSTIAYGKSEYLKIWGNRKNEDNWRWSNKNASQINNTLDVVEVDASEDELLDPKFYIAQIPVDQKAIDSITKDRNYAYYQLGLIYKEKFKEYNLSKERFQTLLTLNPDEKLVLPTKYNLYKIYELQGQTDEALIAKNEIIKDYPDSRYATILQNPESALNKDENNPETIYESLYDQLINQKYGQVITQCDQYINTLDEDPLTPKFELLKATATGRLYGYEAYAKAINYVAYNYANTPEGQQAQNIAENVLPKLQPSEFADNPEDTNFKVVYYFNNASEETIQEFAKKLEEEIKTVNVFDLTMSIDLYNPTTTFVLIHGLTSKEGAMGYAEAISERKKNKIIHQHFAISSANYRTLQIHKNMDAYLSIQ